MQGLTSVVCGKYSFQIAFYMYRGYTPSNSSRSSPAGATQTDRWNGCSLPNSGPTCRLADRVNAAAAAYKKYVIFRTPSFLF